MNKRGHIEISFGMIFSIILIIAILGISFYAITKFLEIKSCTELGLFHEDFQNKVNSIWASSSAKTSFEGRVPSRIESICFAQNNSASTNAKFGVQYKDLSRYIRNGENTFIYPSGKACDSPSMQINHLNLNGLSGFECFEVDSGKVILQLEKTNSDSEVRLISGL